MQKDQVAVITGAASGIGLATARQFVEGGRIVVGVDRNEGALTEAVVHLGNRFIPKKCDVSREVEIANFADEFSQNFDHLDVLVNNAGLARFTNIEQMTVDDFDFHFDLLVKGPMFFVKHFTPLLRKSPAPSIVNISSAAAWVVTPNHHLYSAAKLALEKFTRHMAIDLPGIRSNTILPGWIHTGIWKAIGLDDDQTMSYFKAVTKRIPCGRIGKPEDIANCVTFLCSEKASYINGASIVIDGGWICAGEYAGTEVLK